MRMQSPHPVIAVVSIILVLSYAALNALLAVLGVVIPLNPVAPLALAAPALCFAAAAICLVVGALKRHHVVVIIGLVLGSIAPILYGSLVEGGNVWLHHGVRAVLASGIMALWYLGWMRKWASARQPRRRA